MLIALCEAADARFVLIGWADDDWRAVCARRAIVNGVLGAPKSRHGARTLPLSAELTLETYGHLIDGELGNPLELNDLGIQTGGV